MQLFFKHYIQLTIVLTLCLAPLTMVAQDMEANEILPLLDTITLVKKYKQEADIAIDKFDFNLAILKISEANKLVRDIKDLNLKGEVVFSNAHLQYHIHNYFKASKLNKDAIDIMRISKNHHFLGDAYLLQAIIATKLFYDNEAEVNYKKADSIFLSQNNESGKSSILLGRGILELKKGKPKVAVNYLNAGITLFKEFKKPRQEANSLLVKAKALLSLEDDEDNTYLNQSKKALQEAQTLINAKNYYNLKIESYTIASEIAIKEGNTIEALDFLKKHKTQTDSLNLIYTQAISTSQEQNTDVGELKKKIVEQENVLLEKEKSESLNKVTNGLSIALIAILSLLTLSLYKNNNLRAKANNLLQDKNTELQLAKEKAEKASLAKAQFLSTITHELRTPLYAVTGLTHLLIEEEPKEHQKEHLNSLKFSGEYLLSLINNILDLNKLEANKVEIEKTTFDLKRRIEDVLVALKKSADDKKTILRLEFDESIPQKLSGDPLKLSQVLINLIGNSVKFTQNGEVVVRVRKIDQLNNNVKLNFEIQDNGVGISKKKQKTIFETFSQGSLQINRKFGGTGLGLSIVKNLLELLNSKIQLESQIGEGSKFWFNLDIDIAIDSLTDKVTGVLKKEIDYKALAGKNILVVEDNKINQMITKKILEKHQVICLVSDNGTDAVKMVQENNFDVVLMDIHMPGISGIEATQKIRSFNKETPIIALTAVTIDENLDEFYRAGFSEIIPKPFKPEEFFQKIHDTIFSSAVES